MYSSSYTAEEELSRCKNKAYSAALRLESAQGYPLHFAVVNNTTEEVCAGSRQKKYG
jgi:hypothetical protein